MKRTLIIAALLTVTLSAWGQDKSDSTWTGLLGSGTGNSLIDACTWVLPENSQEPSQQGIACMTFIHGVIEERYLMAQPGHDLCIPAGVTMLQDIKVILKYADEHPESLNQKASLLVTRAMSKAWGANCQ